jgi:ABC-type sugar transport system ATPase subunit
MVTNSSSPDRLATIAFYDRILVLSEGSVAEFDTPLNLFDKEDSIFRASASSLTHNEKVRDWADLLLESL